MNVVVEGFDGTGKTTLCRKIRKTLGYSYATHRDRPIGRREYADRCKINYQLAIEPGVPIVYDRFAPISEHIYRDNGGETFDRILSEIRACNVSTIVHCSGPVHRIRPESNGTALDDADTARVVRNAHDYLSMYDVLMSDLSRYIRVLQCDIDDEHGAERVISYLKHQQKHRLI